MALRASLIAARTAPEGFGAAAPTRILFAAVIPHRRESLVSGRQVNARRSRPRSGAEGGIDVVAASGTIEAEEDG